jgi:hypothetical protein
LWFLGVRKENFLFFEKLNFLQFFHRRRSWREKMIERDGTAQKSFKIVVEIVLSFSPCGKIL